MLTFILLSNLSISFRIDFVSCPHDGYFWLKANPFCEKEKNYLRSKSVVQ